MTLLEQIISDIKTEPIILYMKGTKEIPMCGFSSTAINILNMHGVEYKAVNILEDPDIRIELSEYSKWPTIPQLFVDSKLIGGCDIMIEMHNNGDLKKILDK